MISLNLSSSSSASQPDAEASPSRTDEFDWRSAYQRVQSRQQQSPREDLPQEPPPAPQQPVDPLLQPQAFQTAPLREPQPLRVAPPAPTVTAQRVDALLAQDPAPVATPTARIWQVELPALQPGWQLRVEQLQPQAPLRLDLSVPAVLQTQARRQLADLDKRLRDAGHDVLGTRLNEGPRVRSPRVDGVKS